MKRIDVQVDRLVLSGMDLTPQRAERIRELVTAESQRLLGESGRQPYLTTTELSRLSVRLKAPMNLGARSDDHRLATNVAQSVAQALDGVKEA